MRLKVSWASPRLRLAASRVAGLGVFANEAIRKEETLCVFGGDVLPIEDLRVLEQTNPEAVACFRNNAIQVSDDLLLGVAAEEVVTLAEYVNHCCAPNAGFISPIEIVAMRDIASGEEISIDYAMCDATGLFDMRCQCGHPNCRGTIRGDDWQRPELQQAYWGYWSPFSVRRIAAHATRGGRGGAILDVGRQDKSD